MRREKQQKIEEQRKIAECGAVRSIVERTTVEITNNKKNI